MKKKSKKLENYISKEELFDEVLLCQEKNEGKCSEKLGKMFLQMVIGISRRPNFINYSFKEDMIGDAIIACLKVINKKKFKPEFSTNAFGYFTKVIFRSFINQITTFKTKSQKLNHWIDIEYEKIVLDSKINFTPDMVQDKKCEKMKIDEERIKKENTGKVYFIDPITQERIINK